VSATRKNAGSPVALGFRAVRGGGVTVAVALKDDEPAVVLSTFLATGAEGDRLSQEPYHVAVVMPRGPGGGPSAEAESAVAEGLKRQGKLAAKGLADIVRQLSEENYEPTVAALLVNRAGWVTDRLSYCLAFPDHPPVAEGLAVRDALRFAIKEQGLDIAELDEKTLPDLASQMLSLSTGAIDARLKTLGAAAGKPWRKEQKLACLAAWLTLTTHEKR
jgi:hypothetical protein